MTETVDSTVEQNAVQENQGSIAAAQPGQAAPLVPVAATATIEDRLTALEKQISDSIANFDHATVAAIKEEWPKFKEALEAHGIRLP